MVNPAINIKTEKIIEAAKAGGSILKKYFGKSLDVVQKSSAADFKTVADEESEGAVLAVLAREFPDFNIFSEEKGWVSKNSDYTFYVDPLDGTNNFVLGLANFSVSIGLAREKELIAGVVYSPIIDNTYYAVKGEGAFLDGVHISVSREPDIMNATICQNLGWGRGEGTAVKIFQALDKMDAKRVTINWSPAFDFCMLASGRVEGVINNGSEIHDFSAGKLIAHEAGSKITDFSGHAEHNDLNRIFIASNGTSIHGRLVEALDAAGIS